MGRRREIVAIAIALLVVAIDQFVKIWVKTHFFYGETVPLIGGADKPFLLQLLFIENNGFAFGMEAFSKPLLSVFRVVASVLFVMYMLRMAKAKVPMGYLLTVALVTAGTIGNTIDGLFYGVMFDDPQAYGVTAQLFPPEGGYAPLLAGKVVDMIGVEWDWANWLPWIGGTRFRFAIFNIADAALSVGVVVLILFYSKYLATPVKPQPEGEAVGDVAKDDADSDTSQV